jgi:hypothetical protein
LDNVFNRAGGLKILAEIRDSERLHYSTASRNQKLD